MGFNSGFKGLIRNDSQAKCLKSRVEADRRKGPMAGQIHSHNYVKSW